MRGDSLRDLYAKGIALAGLAVLAGAGALFDYWPVSSEVPQIAGPARPSLTDIPHRAHVPSWAGEPDRPAVAIARRERRQPAAPVVVTAAAADASAVASIAAPTPAVAVVALAVSPVALTSLGAPLALARPSAVTASAEPPLTEFALPVIDHRYAEVPVSGPLMQFAAPVADDDESAMDFVAGAFKKTGRTLMRTSVKTGATIRDALLRVGGAFKKVL